MTASTPIGEHIQDVLAVSLGRDRSTIKPEQNIRDDLGLDSLRTFELLYDLERAFDLEIPNEDLPGLQTLADVITYVEARVSPSRRPTKTPSSTATSKKRMATATASSSGSQAKTASGEKGSTVRSQTPIKSKTRAAKTVSKRAPIVTSKKQGVAAKGKKP